jgi:hypothetical protein
MAANNLKKTTDLSNVDPKEIQDSTTQTNGAVNAKTGGQMNGGIIVHSGERSIQTENQKGPESSDTI